MGDQVSVMQVRGNWAEIRSAANAALNGWTSLSNLSSRRIIATGAGATAAEVALAGKGFDRDVEDAFRATGDLNFVDVDRTEAITVCVEELYAFITAGRLFTGE